VHPTERGKFITLEGPDGSGKTTLSRALATKLEQIGISVVLTREPGDGPVGPAIREVLLSGSSIDAWTEAFLFLADRRQHCNSVIYPALDLGKWVICDRFADSTIVYQGYGRGLDIERLRDLNDIATMGRVPDVTLLLDLAPQMGLARLLQKNRLDEEPIEFHERVRKGFLNEAARAPERWVVLDASLPIEQVIRDAWAAIKPPGVDSLP
jgi:dTMP kinase